MTHDTHRIPSPIFQYSSSITPLYFYDTLLLLPTGYVHPYGLVVKKGDWYLIAFCEAGQEIRTFKCERIMAVKVKPSAEFFEVPVDFSLENHWMKHQKNTCLWQMPLLVTSRPRGIRHDPRRFCRHEAYETLF
ncbi:WYL domain-containing protein [Paenibacillus maysiensis]|uniref:helix-turn-helix transcriptional regulator n=1 Tax=Paenibacillus maysiensis TaxID=1155954 RepID=UPI0024752EC3|nr:WYL domain-containing protein [Paenibacillus maysiensis]